MPSEKGISEPARDSRREELPALNLAEDTLDVIRKGFAKLTAGA